MRNLLLAALGLVFLAGCKVVKIENGQVPEEYLYVAEQFVGNYDGEFNGVEGNMMISLQGQKVMLTTDFDILGGECESKIGMLRSIRVKEKNDDYSLTAATFDFSPGKCKRAAEGRSITFWVKRKKDRIKLNAQLLEYTMTNYFCRPGGDPMRGGPVHRCRNERREYYLDGTFYRR